MAQIDDLPPLRDVISRFGLDARKSLGQNFLLDLNLTSRIARAGGDLAGRTVVEVGPGPGGLTRAILAAGAARVIAIERDERCLAALAEISAHYPDRLEVISGDALSVNVSAMLDADQIGKARIIANLPYNVATPLLVGWLRTEPWPPWWASATLMFQREVAERICASPGSKIYGRLGVLAGWRSEARMLFDVSRQAFVPPPNVTSTIVHLVPRAQPFACNADTLERVVASAFGQRRKMLRSSLGGFTTDPAGLLQRAGVEPTRRAEELDVAEFVALANAAAVLP
jgi:16S rRNA (adenine1518-N6/adenine1519-N6)-dimethyltransferase